MILIEKPEWLYMRQNNNAMNTSNNRRVSAIKRAMARLARLKSTTTDSRLSSPRMLPTEKHKTEVRIYQTQNSIQACMCQYKTQWDAILRASAATKRHDLILWNTEDLAESPSCSISDNCDQGMFEKSNTKASEARDHNSRVRCYQGLFN